MRPTYRFRPPNSCCESCVEMFGTHDKNFGILVGETILTACVQEFQILVLLSGSIRIRIWGDLTFRGVRADFRSVRSLEVLLGKTIVRVEVPDDETLVLRLDSGESLILHDSLPNFESFEITWPKDGFLVV